MSECRKPEEYPPGKYFIKRHGAWFRPNASGYSLLLAGAALYDRDDAVKYLDVEGLTIHRAEDVIKDLLNEINGHFSAIVRLEQFIQDIKATA